MSPFNSRIPLLGLAVLLTLSLIELSAPHTQALTTFTDDFAQGDRAACPRSSEARACSSTTTCEILEDFDADDGLWTEYDPQGKIDLDYANDQRLEFDNWIRTDKGYVYRPCTTQNFAIEYDINITGDGGNAKVIGPGFSDGQAPSRVNDVTNGAFSLYYAGFGGAQIDIATYVNGVSEWNWGGSGDRPNRIWISTGTTYYVRFEKSGDILTLSIFSDPSRTTHVPGSPKTVTTALSGTTFSYFYMLNGHVSIVDWEWTTGWMDNVRVTHDCSAVACDTFEDFDRDDGLWTELDPQGKIYLDYANDQRLEFDHWIRPEEGYVYKQYGMPDFVVEYDVNITDDGGNGKVVGPGFSDGCEPSPVNEVANGVFNLYYAGVGPAIYIATYVNNGQEWAYPDSTEAPNRIGISLGTTYYIRFEKAGGSLTLSIFSDPARTTHIPGSPKTVTTVLSNTIFEYFYMLNADLGPPEDWEWTTGWMDNVGVTCACGAAACDTFEDFGVDDGLWTEYDPQERIDLDYNNDHRLEFDNWIRTEDGYVYKQCGAQDFAIEYDINITADGGNAKMIGPGFSDGCAPSPVNEVANGAFAVYWSGFGQAQINIITYVNGSPEWHFGDSGELPNRIWISMGTTYHVRFEKFGDGLTLSIFSDPSRTMHVPGSPKTVTTVLADTIFSYFYILNGILASPPDNWEWTTGWMNNVSVVSDCGPVPPCADLAISQQTATTEVIAGGEVTFTIEATNHGPADAPTATLRDEFPAALTCAWTGNASGSGPVLEDTFPLPAGSSVSYTVSCGIDPAASGTLSNTATIASPSDCNPDNNSDTVHWTILPRGDCNGDGLVDADDVDACNQEIFDGDGNFWLDVPGGTYPGHPEGCDANADTFVDAGDVSCKHLLMSASSCSTAPPPALSVVELSLPYEIPVNGQKVIAEVTLEPDDEVNSVAFALDFAPNVLQFDPTDGDGDGIPDAVRFPETSTVTRFVRFDADELRFLITDPTQALAAGVLVAIEFQYLGCGTTVESGVVFSRDPLASFGDLDGRSRPGRTILRGQPLKTLILTHVGRMQTLLGMTPTETLTLFHQLQRLADHPRVLGRVVDLGSEPALTALYQAWDGAGNDPDGANNVLFGNQGIHDVLERELAAGPGVEYLILVGDDRILPMARLRDFTLLQLESAYTSGPDLTSDGTSVGRALAADRFLSDDPLAARFAIDPQDLGSGRLILPELAVGRLVETPEEILTAIDTYLAQDGFLNVSPPVGPDHRVLVTGYDFLLDGAKRICRRWRNAFPDAPDSVNCDLVGATWGLPTVGERGAALRDHLAGGYSVMSLNGHGTHYQEGIPGLDPHDIRDLNAMDLYGPDACGIPSQGALDFSGSVAYSTGCHGALPVPGSCAGDADHSLDLPQTFLARGVQAYAANTGYGWGLVHGIGYSEEMVNVLTRELAAGGNVVIGDAVRRAKQRYYLESPRHEIYDVKTSLQWTLYGFPMYEIRTGIASKAADRELGAGAAGSRPAVERFGAVSVERRLSNGGDAIALPEYLTRLELNFDLQAPGVYTKYDTTGEVVDTAGCPDPEGCYYALDERSTGESDLPIQPYLVYDSRLSGTSQHGILWKGGAYEEELGWVPIFGRLITNGSPPPELGSTPSIIRMGPRSTRLREALGEDPLDCRPVDGEWNRVALPTGETVMDDNQEYSIEHLFREIDLEIFYYNSPADPGANCDRTGPEFGAGPHHELLETSVRWTVAVSDAETEVWRVVVVYDDGTLDAQGRHLWIPVELEDDGTGVWQGNVPASSFAHFTYFLQAVDRRGNVSWLLYVPEVEPTSGVSLDLPLPIEVVVEDDGLLFADGFETGDVSRWSGSSG